MNAPTRPPGADGIARCCPDLNDPANFLHRVDPASDRATIVRTTRDELSAASFLDDRAGFVGPHADVALDRVRRCKTRRSEQVRLLVHVGFCGSTHLARLLECGGRATVLREPQALTDLANHHSAAARQDVRDARVPALLGPVLGLLDRRWAPDMPVVLKPSNWANVLLPSLDPADVRMVAIVSSRRQFLRAVLRGGPERLGYAGRAALHFSSQDVSPARAVSQALALPWPPSDVLLALGGIAHAVQINLIGAALRRIAEPRSAILQQDDVRDRPLDAVARAAAVLAVGAPTLEDMSSQLTRYSKNPAQRFDRARERDMEAEIDRRHQASLARVEAWLSRHVGIA